MYVWSETVLGLLNSPALRGIFSGYSGFPTLPSPKKINTLFIELTSLLLTNVEFDSVTVKIKTTEGDVQGFEMQFVPLLEIKYYTGCIKKMVIELWSALASSLYNLRKSFFHGRKDLAFSFRMSPFL